MPGDVVRRRARRGPIVVRLIALALATTVALAADVGAEPLRLAQSWEDLSPEQRSRAMENFQRFQRMPRQSREQVERRWQDFRQMPPTEQDRIRRNFDTYRNMSPDQREDFMDRYRRHQGGPR